MISNISQNRGISKCFCKDGFPLFSLGFFCWRDYINHGKQRKNCSFSEVDMSMYELILKRRTIRRFQQTAISLEMLKEIVNAGRLAPSASNLQPLEFLVVENKATTDLVFTHTKWAGYLPPEKGKPGKEQAPVAYVLILVNKKIRPDSAGADVGAAAENMILTALERGVAACWIGSIIDRPVIKEKLGIPEQYELDSLLALGYPSEEPIEEPLVDSVKYYLDEEGRLHVPKRTLDSVLHLNRF
jgi:nitroreductase